MGEPKPRSETTTYRWSYFGEDSNSVFQGGMPPEAEQVGGDGAWDALAVVVANTVYAICLDGMELTADIPLDRQTAATLACFMFLGHWGRRPWLDHIVLALFLPMMAYVSIMFSHWYFAG